MAFARELYRSAELVFAALTCPVGDDEWGEDNLTTHPIVALPLSPVWQVHDGRPRILMTPNSTVFHHDGGEYRRERFLDRSYRCLFFFPSERLVREIVAEVDPPAAEADAVRFPARAAPLDGRAFAAARRVAGRLASIGPTRSAAEPLFEILRSAVLGVFRERNPAPGRRTSTARARAELVDAAKALLAGQVGDPWPLERIAAGVHVSPYHLARVFRSETGYSVHAYLTNLRVREGLVRLADAPSRDLASVGADLGFSTHSHFTASFRGEMGVVPSEIEASTISTA